MNLIKRALRAAHIIPHSNYGVPTNSIFVIHPYKWNGIYVFDKPKWRTEKEAFVSGATEYLQILSGDAEEFNLLFSTTTFPDSHMVELVSSDTNGSIYYSKEFDHYLWLCPYLFRFYDKAPEFIYLKIENIIL